jgi:hypothetical protein
MGGNCSAFYRMILSVEDPNYLFKSRNNLPIKHNLVDMGIIGLQKMPKFISLGLYVRV